MRTLQLAVLLAALLLGCGRKTEPIPPPPRLTDGAIANDVIDAIASHANGAIAASDAIASHANDAIAANEANDANDAIANDANDANQTIDAKTPAAITVDVAVPTSARALQRWLVAAHYKQWPAESTTHPSDGPHGDAVRTFITPALAASLASKASAHPQGVAAVKELYDKAGKHMGWAVGVKTKADSASGRNWYWYEVFSTAPAAKAPYQGIGVKLCRECHAEGGTDQVLIPFPLS